MPHYHDHSNNICHKIRPLLSTFCLSVCSYICMVSLHDFHPILYEQTSRRTSILACILRLFETRIATMNDVIDPRHQYQCDLKNESRVSPESRLDWTTTTTPRKNFQPRDSRKQRHMSYIIFILCIYVYDSYRYIIF